MNDSDTGAEFDEQLGHGVTGRCHDRIGDSWRGASRIAHAPAHVIRGWGSAAPGLRRPPSVFSARSVHHHLSPGFAGG